METNAYKSIRDHSPTKNYLNLLKLKKYTIMKSILTALIILFVAFSASAQLDKKTWLVGGSGSFYSNNNTYVYPAANGTGKETNIDVSAKIGYFIIDKLAVGLTPTYFFYKAKFSGGAEPQNHKFAIGPFVRYYFLDKEKSFNILSEVSYQFGKNVDNSPPRSKGKFNKFSIAIGPEIFFNSSVGLEILLGYKATTLSIENSPYEFSLINKGFLISVGFQIHLEKM